MKLFTKSLCFVVLASLAFGSALTRTKEEILARIVNNTEAKPFLFFEGYGKFPHAIINYPMKNEVRDILFACDTNGVDFVSNPSDFANLIPAKFRTSWPLGSIYIEHKYSGFFADKLVLSTVATNGHEEHFKEPFMVSEYRSGMAMKWVFSTTEQFRGFKKYFLKNIIAPATTIPVTATTTPTATPPTATTAPKITTAAKPLLVLEIEKNPEALTDEDLSFLDTYFEVADLANPEVKQVFENYTKNLMQAAQDAAEYAVYQVGKSFNYMTVEMLDKDFDGFEGKKLALRALKWGVGIVTLVVIGKIVNAYVDKYGWPWINKLPGLGKTDDALTKITKACLDPNTGDLKPGIAALINKVP